MFDRLRWFSVRLFLLAVLGVSIVAAAPAAAQTMGRAPAPMPGTAWSLPRVSIGVLGGAVFAGGPGRYSGGIRTLGPLGSVAPTARLRLMQGRSAALTVNVSSRRWSGEGSERLSTLEQQPPYVTQWRFTRESDAATSVVLEFVRGTRVGDFVIGALGFTMHELRGAVAVDQSEINQSPSESRFTSWVEDYSIKRGAMTWTAGFERRIVSRATAVTSARIDWMQRTEAAGSTNRSFFWPMLDVGVRWR